MGISSREGNGACTGRCHCVPFPFSPPSAWVWASVAWLTSRKVPEASSASSYGQLRHNPPWVGAELDLRLRGDDIFNFMLNPALAECLHFAGHSGDIEWIRPDSPHEGTHSPIGEITRASNSTQHALGTHRRRDVLGVYLGNALQYLSWSLREFPQHFPAFLNCSSNLGKTFRKLYRYYV